MQIIMFRCDGVACLHSAFAMSARRTRAFPNTHTYGSILLPLVRVMMQNHYAHATNNGNGNGRDKQYYVVWYFVKCMYRDHVHPVLHTDDDFFFLCVALVEVCQFFNRTMNSSKIKMNFYNENYATLTAKNKCGHTAARNSELQRETSTQMQRCTWRNARAKCQHRTQRGVRASPRSHRPEPSSSIRRMLRSCWWYFSFRERDNLLRHKLESMHELSMANEQTANKEPSSSYDPTLTLYILYCFEMMRFYILHYTSLLRLHAFGVLFTISVRLFFGVFFSFFLSFGSSFFHSVLKIATSCGIKWLRLLLLLLSCNLPRCTNFVWSPFSFRYHGFLCTAKM